MSTRISQQSVYRLCPRLAKHLTALGDVAPDSTVDRSIIHLVNLRVSQINHCCFCQHMHSQEARDDGEHQVRLDVLPAWREAPCFSTQERAALAWAEALTLVSQQAVSDNDYQNALAAFGEQGLIDLTAIIVQINSWNRVSVGFQFAPDISI
ncbi:MULTISPECIES: carboxymuconolactone decarboxylase family protein [Halomonadaceae]|jgi:AhpD family alkylhydroperoxidase|uniref:Carboxymuconolactone decarboxylase n=2 Tax=Vreelandella titanicae TaxID=664683 RepID=L9UA42_9GAMM|nr:MULTISPECIES: carboxymuconolactone decarboxylase family protein [Halomonas]QGQ70853.1 carboxymuconolactone decarboxylase family protein [Halomonas sp. PA16-9]UEQ02260.1 carboxymuconolactone decarboxylase family protein [Halomonas profundus]ELY21795.1 Carboxymuconolactone decarboxylase [Halomonas titanicae BH1]KIN14558.1 alkylhydroperoxidase [Halomonas sp. KHS3]MCD1588567.1 carboxymuconolactone decarboxylase family protein [Halomonas sp. IOP_14]